MKEKVEGLLRESIGELVENGTLADLPLDSIAAAVPANKEFGDYTTNIAMVSASRLRKKPREIASIIRQALEKHSDVFEKVDIAGPGFINLYLNPAIWVGELKDIVEKKHDYGKSAFGAGKKVQVEFVSANPTGPLHIGHGRGAAVGDTLARILSAAGFTVEAEYYINDIGNQMNILGLSVFIRYQELQGMTVAFPENGYQGEYIRELAREMQRIHGDSLLSKDREAAVGICREYAAEAILNGIKEDLELFNVHFDHWFGESSLYRDNKVQEALSYLEARGLSYTEDGALWFRTSKFGDEKDRVLKKQDGSLTYFAPDIAYHRDKLGRGFRQIIDIWGADHHGYVPRMKAAFAALGAPEDCFHALLIQLVSLVRGGKPVSMSTRSGEFVTLREIMDEVGKDVARYFFLMRRCDSHLVFDLDLAKKKSDENPVYYIQYAHARICSIIRNAGDQGLFPEASSADLGRLGTGDDLDLIKTIAAYPDVVVSSAADLEPHRIAFYLLDLATAFHRFYNRNRVITDNRPLTTARLVLVDAVRQVLKNALALMGIDAPESM